MNPTATFAAVALAAGLATAAPQYFEGFEDPGFTPGGDNWNNYNGGDIQRVASGTNGVTSASGNAHAIITNLSVQNDYNGNPALGAVSPYTRFGGYSSSFDGGFTASIDIYLDTAWTDGQGFDYSVAVNGSDGNHQRDFVWRVGVDAGQLKVSTANGTIYSFTASAFNGAAYDVTASGWYTFEQVFRDDAGTLAVDYNLKDTAGTTLFTATSSNPADTIATEIGGNRYGWSTYDNIETLAIDNVSLVPAPSTFAALSLAGLTASRRRRR